MAEPMIRFKRDDGSDFPAYQKMRMADIFTEIIDKKHPDMPVLSIQQGVGTVLRDESGRNINYDKTNLNGYKAMRKGDFIIHLRTFEGGLECSNHDGISSPAYRILRTDKLIPEAFIGYFRSQKFIEGKLAVSVVGIRDGKNIDMPTFWEIEMDIPCLEEQQKIASFFADLDEVIQTSEAEVAALEKQKKGAMQKIFSQEVRFKMDDGSDYPDWEERSVNDICSVSTGKGNTQDKKDDGEYPFYVRSPIIEHSDTFLFDQEAVITVGDGVGTGKVFHYVNGKYNLHQRCYRMFDFVEVDAKWFYYFFSMNFYKRVRSMTAKTSVDSVRMNMITEMAVDVPCLEEQQKIADFLSDFDTAIDLAKQELEKWKLLKKGLMQQMFV